MKYKISIYYAGNSVSDLISGLDLEQKTGIVDLLKNKNDVVTILLTHMTLYVNTALVTHFVVEDYG